MITEQDLHPGWRMSRKQHGRYWRMMSDCAKKLGITQADARERIHVRAFGENRSAKTINHKADFDELEKEWAAILDDTNIKRQLAKQDQPNVRVIHLIRTDYRAQLSILLPIKYGHITIGDLLEHVVRFDPIGNKCPNLYLAEQYIKSILQGPRFKKNNFTDLDTIQRPRSTGVKLSELEMFRDTIAGRISTIRRQIGLEPHDLCMLAGIQCACSDCSVGEVPTLRCIMQPHHQKELATVGDNDKPF
jgi:hypothetical protein